MKTVVFEAEIKGHPAIVTVKASAIEAIETGDDGAVLGVHVAGKRYKMNPRPCGFPDPMNDVFYRDLLDAMVNPDDQKPGDDDEYFLINPDAARHALARSVDDENGNRLELVSVERRPEEAELLQDCALAARLMTEAIGYLSCTDFINHDDNVGAEVCVDYMREFVRSYEHVIDLRRPDPDLLPDGTKHPPRKP